MPVPFNGKRIYQHSCGDFLKCSLNRVLVQTSYAGAIMRNKHDIEDLAFEALHSAKKSGKSSICG